jgi:hypothetical protein
MTQFSVSPGASQETLKTVLLKMHGVRARAAQIGPGTAVAWGVLAALDTLHRFALPLKPNFLLPQFPLCCHSV